MDNPEGTAQLQALIHHQVHHELEHFSHAPDPVLVNRMVGESMRHMGSFLEMSASAYLPIRPEEILVKPELLAADSLDAVLLTKRTRSGDKNGFLVLATCKMVEDTRRFDLVCFKPDNFNLSATQFLTPPIPVGNEIIRQLNVIVKGEGVLLVFATVVSNYFPATPAGTDSELFTSESGAPAPPAAAPAAAATPGGLPPVMDDNLL